MSRTFTKLLTHVVFSTKDRQPMIRTEIRSELFSYLGGLTHELKGKAYGINGTNDHVHMLIGLPPNVATSDALRFIKANSSGWVREKWKKHSHGNSATPRLVLVDQMCPPCSDTSQIKKLITNASHLKTN